jgi:ABC-2 type transport system permease protein
VIGYARRSSRPSRSATYGRRGRCARQVRRSRIEPRVWYNPELRSTLFLVPGLIAYIAMITAVVSTALSVVREKERGTMEQVRMAPIGTLPFIVGQDRAVLRDVVRVGARSSSLAAMALFDLPMRGSWLLLWRHVAVPGRRARHGLLISTIAETQQVAFQAALLSSFLPTMLLSGFIFPIASMPTPLQVITYVVPARYFLVALRGIVLKGVRARGVLADSSARWRSSPPSCSGWRPCGCGGSGPEGRMRRLLHLSGRSCSSCGGPAPVRHRHHGADHPAHVLGYAATTDVTERAGGGGRCRPSPASRELVQRFEASRYFTLVGTVAATVHEIEPWLERGLAWMALTMPPATARTSRPGGRRRAGGGRRHRRQLHQRGARLRAEPGRRLRAGARRDAGAGAHAGARRAHPRLVQPALESRDFMIPGIIALLLLVVTTNLSSMAIVREKELGTLEQLNVTPLARWELIVGKLLPYALIGVIDVLLVTAVALLWFEVPLRGSIRWLLLGMSLIYLMTTLGLGLFVSTISHTQQQAMMTTTFFFLMPMIYLSGFVFPIENMPAWIQPATYLIPLRYFLTIVRGIFLKGVGSRCCGRTRSRWPRGASCAPVSGRARRSGDVGRVGPPIPSATPSMSGSKTPGRAGCHPGSRAASSARAAACLTAFRSASGTGRCATAWSSRTRRRRANRGRPRASGRGRSARARPPRGALPASARRSGRRSAVALHPVIATSRRAWPRARATACGRRSHRRTGGSPPRTRARPRGASDGHSGGSPGRACRRARGRAGPCWARTAPAGPRAVAA